MPAVVAGAVTLALSLALPVVVKPLLQRLGIMDVPNARSSHERPILRGLGLAVLIAMTVGAAVAIVWFAAAPDAGAGARWDVLLIVALGSLAAGLLGLGEDLRGISVLGRSVCLILIAVTVPVLLLIARSNPGAGAPFGASGGYPNALGLPPDLPLWGAIAIGAYAVFFISSYINVANFMDGLNGISGLHGVIAGLAFAAGGLIAGERPWLVAAGLILAAGFGGFLPWNLSRPGAFLGDVGSYLLGGATAVTSLAAWLSGIPLLATIGPMVIYFGDVGVTLVKRVRAGHRWDEPHKEHAYQRIQQLGYSHVQASGLTALCTAAASVLGLCSLFTSLPGTLALLAGGLVILGVYLALPRLLPRRA
nr:UDP-phosphate alpha-N-acetyl-D-fucosaminephosphotransferase [Leucobacter edaphi]